MRGQCGGAPLPGPGAPALGDTRGRRPWEEPGSGAEPPLARVPSLSQRRTRGFRALGLSTEGWEGPHLCHFLVTFSTSRLSSNVAFR